MTNLLGITDYVVIGCMLAVSASVGLYFRFTGGRQKTTNEFLMGGRSMGIGPVAFSLMATYMSAISVLGVPSETYMYGSQLIMWMIGTPIGAYIAAYGFVPVYFDMETSTAYEYLERRFGKTTRTIAAFFFALQMILYMAVVLYAPSLALNAVTGLSTWTSVVSLAAVCTFYCSLGGLKAVLWTDVFQALLMYVTIIAVVIKASMLVGFTDIFSIADKGGRLIFFNVSFNFSERYTLWNAIASGFLFSSSTYGTNQAQIQRLLSVGDLKRAQTALFWSIPLIMFFNFFNFYDGIAIYAMYHDCDPMKDPSSRVQSPDQLMPFAILKLFSDIPGLTGLCISGVFSASLSTVSSAVNSLTAVTMEDFIRPHCFCKCLSETWMTFLAKVLAVGYGVLTLLLTFVVANFRGVIEASNVMFGVVGGPILGLYTLGMFTKTANEKGTLIGLCIGFILNAWLGFGSYIARPPVPALLQSTDGCVPSNITLFSNESSLLSLERDYESAASDEERYILPVYKIAFIWYPIIGALTVIAAGYTSSFLLSFWIDVPEVKPENVSPLVRNWYFKPKDKKEKDANRAIYPEIEMTEKNGKGIAVATNGHTNLAMTDS